MSVFGALNRFISRLDSEGPPSTSGPNKGACGFQVLRNTNSDIPLDPWYDFIVGINGRQIDNPDPHLFAQEVRNCAGGGVRLTVWSAKGQRPREIHIPLASPPSPLGVSLQWSSLSCTSDVWHILEVIPHSPADVAGLLPYGDYIVGTPEGLVRGEPGLGELVEDHINRALRLWVYNHEYAVTRLVSITPSRSWGGEGALGCVLGFGALHQLPMSLSEPGSAPGDTLFEGSSGEADKGRFSNEEGRGYASYSTQGSRSGSPQRDLLTPANYASSNLMVPAAMSAVPPLAPPKGGGEQVAGGGRARKGRGVGRSPSRAFDEMWSEGAEKSKEEDFAPKSKSPVPPPPKAGPLVGENGQGQGQILDVEQERSQTRSPDPIIEDDDGKQ